MGRKNNFYNLATMLVSIKIISDFLTFIDLKVSFNFHLKECWECKLEIDLSYKKGRFTFIILFLGIQCMLHKVLVCAADTPHIFCGNHLEKALRCIKSM